MAIPQSFLVPITNAAASLDAVSIACTMAKPQKGKVYVVHVIEVQRSLALNAEMESEARRGEQLLRRAEEIAAHAGMRVDGQLLQARDAGQAIVDEARDREVDAIILGIAYSPLVGASRLGHTVDRILGYAACQVWVVREAAGTRTAQEE